MLVGAAACSQRPAPGALGLGAVDLMVRAARAAADDAGAPELLHRVEWIGIPRGTWTDPNAGRRVAAALGAPVAASVVAEVGVLQEALMARAVSLVATGEVEVALVVGGEARTHERLRRDPAAGEVEVPPGDAGGAPGDDVIWAAASLGIADVEIERNIVTPVTSFALIDRALAARHGWPPLEHRDRLARLWAAFGRVAADNPEAWDRSAPPAEQIATPSDTNRVLAFPYTKLLASQWNVDQAAALLVCTAEVAQRAGVDRARLVRPWVSVISDHAVPLVQRAALDRSPGATVALRRAFEHVASAGVGTIGDVQFVDLYSCFPAPVQVYAEALGLDLELLPSTPPTVTGGMTFAGGPLNNYVLQAMVELVRRLRAEPGSVGLSSSVSAFLTKQGFSMWSTGDGPRYAALDVSHEVAAVDRPCALAARGTGPATVLASTVDRSGFEPRLVAIVELADGARTIGVSTDPDAVADLESGGPAAATGSTVTITDPGHGEMVL